MVQIHKQTWKVLQEHAEMCVVVVVVFVCWILSILVQITDDEEQYWYEMRYPSDISGFVSYIR